MIAPRGRPPRRRDASYHSCRDDAHLADDTITNQRHRIADMCYPAVGAGRQDRWLLTEDGGLCVRDRVGAVVNAATRPSASSSDVK